MPAKKAAAKKAAPKKSAVKAAPAATKKSATAKPAAAAAKPTPAPKAKPAAEKPVPVAAAAPAAKKAARRVVTRDPGLPVGLDLAKMCGQFAFDKKATDITILDMRGISTATDFSVICTGTSLPHLRAIRKEVVDRLWVEHDVKVMRMDGTPESLWIVADFVDVMVHIFHAETREKYSLEECWSDAPKVPFKPVI